MPRWRKIGSALLVFYNAWVLLSLSIFYLGPIDWPARHSPEVGEYVLVCLVAFDLGALMYRSPMLEAGEGWSIPRFLPQQTVASRVVVATYAILSFVYLFTVTGRSVLSTQAYSLNFGEVYEGYAAHLSVRQSGIVDQLIVMSRAVVFPIALVTFLARFRSDMVVFVLFVLPVVVSGLFRGTDKETLDLLILLIVAAYCHGMASWKSALVVLLIPVAASLFVLRRIARFGGSLPSCLPQSSVCFNYDGFVARNFGDRVEVLWTFVCNYLTNGYQGLAYAFDLDWTPNYGIGHLPPLKEQSCLVTDALCNSSDYQQALTEHGWDASARWTTAYTVIANDLSFWLVPLFLVMLGIAFRRSVVMWRRSRDPLAAGSIVLITMFWIYSSANMQIAISLEWVAATIFLVYYAPWRRSVVAPEDDTERLAGKHAVIEA